MDIYLQRICESGRFIRCRIALNTVSIKDYYFVM